MSVINQRGQQVREQYNAARDINILLYGISALPTDYASRIENFLIEYLGTPKNRVPFGGRATDLTRLDHWLDNPEESPYLLLAAPAGRGKSAPARKMEPASAGAGRYCGHFVPCQHPISHQSRERGLRGVDSSSCSVPR